MSIFAHIGSMEITGAQHAASSAENLLAIYPLP